jgi:hypothetical protein
MGTPIEQARNLGPTTGPELRACGISTLEDLQQVGWKEALLRVVELFPARAHLNMAYGLIGAIEDTDWREIDPTAKAEARELVRRMRLRPLARSSR